MRGGAGEAALGPGGEDGLTASFGGNIEEARAAPWWSPRAEGLLVILVMGLSAAESAPVLREELRRRAEHVFAPKMSARTESGRRLT